MKNLKMTIVITLLFTTTAVIGAKPSAATTENSNKRNLSFEKNIIDVRGDLVRLRIFERNAAGDGKTEDTEPIQKAIGHLVKSGGGTLVFPEGTYCIDGIEVFGARIT